MTRTYLLACILLGSLSFAMPASAACVRPDSFLMDATVMAPLFDAIEANQPELVRKALDDGAPPNEPRRTSSGETTNRTPLIEAISQGNAEIVFDLVGAGADPNLSFALDSEWSAGVTPLGFAISRGDSSIVSILVRSLADTKNVSCDGEIGAQTYAAGFAYPEIVSYVTRDQVEPEALARVIAATQRYDDPRAEIDFLSDQVEVLRQLVEVSFDPSSTTATEAILQSVKSGRVDLTKVLLEFGVSSNVVDEDARLAPTLLQISALRGDMFLVNALLASEADPMIVDALGNSALAYSAAGGDTNIISILAEVGAPLTTNNFGQSALMFASEASAVRALSELGLDPNAVDEFGRTALTLAVSPTPILPYPGAQPAEDNVSIAEALLGVGADPSHADAQGITALMAVARGRADERAELAKVLIAAGAPLDNVDSDGSTILHHFGDTGDVATIELLVDAGADPTSQDALGRTLLHRILETDEISAPDRPAVLSAALAQGAPPDTADNAGQSPLHLVAKTHFEEVGSTLAMLLLEADANPNSEDSEGRTPLMVAIPPDNRAVFLSVGQASGVNLDATAHNSMGALAIAASRDKTQFVEDLLRLGANASLATSAGDTPLHIALTSEAQSAALVLIEHQKDALPSENAVGRTPLHLASQMNLHDATTALLRIGANICHEDSSGKRAIDYAQRPLNDDTIVRQIPPLETYVVEVERYQKARRAFFDDLRRRLERERLRPISPPRVDIGSAERLHSGLADLFIPPQQLGPPTPSLFSLGDYDQALTICTVISIPENPGSNGLSLLSDPSPQCVAEFIRNRHVDQALREQNERTSPTWSML